eukprot:EG_transcript_5486
MRLSVIFVSTLPVSVILSSCATWGLTYSTSYAELRDMASGFVLLTGTAVGEFQQLVSQLINAQAQGNIDAIVGDQLLVTFNAHFTCSDPSSASSTAALDVLTTLKGGPTFPWRVQLGLAVGAIHSGHLGTASFKSMVALGAPLKVASLLSHLSGFDESTVLVCPSLEERIKYAFRLQPVDLVFLPSLGEFNHHYAKSVPIFILLDRENRHGGPQEWLYEVGGVERCGLWLTVFRDLAKAASLEKATADLQQYLEAHPEDRLAQRLLRRLPRWQPRVGLVLAERPDGDPGAPPAAAEEDDVAVKVA